MVAVKTLYALLFAGISLVYASIITWIGDSIIKRIEEADLDPAFSIKGAEFVLGASLIGIAAAFAAWLLIMYHFDLGFWKVVSLRKFIDKEKTIDKPRRAETHENNQD